MGHRVCLVTNNLDRVATLPCNPSIGGPAKGILVREIDALGGVMGKLADMATIQIKMLNSSKGPAVWALRAQIDKEKYPKYAKEMLLNTKNLDIVENYVMDILVEDGEVRGVVLDNGKILHSKTVIITTGTYLDSRVLIGDEIVKMAADGDYTTTGISSFLKKTGFDVIRLKTGTPPRIDKNTIDYSYFDIQEGDMQKYLFSYYNTEYNNLDSVVCYLSHTTLNTKKTILDSLKYSPLYSGVIEGTGPRYCPSIEDKIVRFSEKDIHQLFVEPEGIDCKTMYVQGISTSLPRFSQRKILKTLDGFDNAKILKYGYAIEYDAIDPINLYPTLETMLVKNLYTAGQINGTSGYEEAAAQGLMAAINASLKLKGKNEFILKRNEAYIGVLIDDLVTKGTKEPYRMLTSRAEYRLLLRNDNADLRLSEYGHEIGLLNDIDYNTFLNKKSDINNLINYLSNTKIIPSENKEFLKTLNTTPIKDSILLKDLLKRPEINIFMFENILDRKYIYSVLEQVNIEMKYEGYIQKELKEVQNFIKLENKKIPKDIVYNDIKNLSFEALEKLNKIRPNTIGQASRILGVNPADISILLIYMKGYYNV